MGGMLYNIIFFIIAIGVLVTFHEFGHYWVARLLNVKVLRFSVGFGKPLITWRKIRGKDEIEFIIAAIPLGGYVKMLDEREGEVDKADKHRAFNNQPVLNRIAIVAAGPAFNFILAIFFYWIVFLNGVEGRAPILGETSIESVAAEAGFLAEERVVLVGDTEIDTWQAFRMALIKHGLDGGDLLIRVRDADNIEISRTLAIGDRHILESSDDVIEQLGFQPWQADLPAIIGGVIDQGMAQKSGLITGDEILFIDGVAINNWQHMVKIIQASADKKLQLLILRNSVEQFISITPAVRERNGQSSGFIGAYQNTPKHIADRLKVNVEYGPVEALVKAAEKTWTMSILTLRVLGKMIQGQAALENISGPITIATYAGATASIGFITYLGFLAIISISLGVLNLLPVPMLDGGHLFYYLIEIIKGSPVSERFEAIGQQIGLLLIFMLMSLAIFNDIQRLVN
jgi:regulator of sigma E protease